MSSQTNLTLAKVKKVSKQLDQTIKHIIEDGDYVGEQITFQPIFDDIKIEELLTEYAQLLNEAEGKEIKLSQNMQIYLLNFLAIKHFTHFKDSLPSTLFGENKQSGLLDLLDHFRKTGLLYECVNKMFLPKEMGKLLNKATDVAAMGLLSQDLDKKMMEKFETLKVQNKDVFEQLDNINLENPTQ